MPIDKLVQRVETEGPCMGTTPFECRAREYRRTVCRNHCNAMPKGLSNDN